LLSGDISPVKFICLGKPQMGYNMVRLDFGWPAEWNSASASAKCPINIYQIEIPLRLHYGCDTENPILIFQLRISGRYLKSARPRTDIGLLRWRKWTLANLGDLKWCSGQSTSILRLMSSKVDKWYIG
jgi:hypothetical protein